jgi:hypothetical protein
MSSPCHIELVLSEKEEPVKKEVIHHYCFSVWLKKWQCAEGFEFVDFFFVLFVSYLPWFCSLRLSWQLANLRSLKLYGAVLPLKLQSENKQLKRCPEFLAATLLPFDEIFVSCHIE